jgi:hypothetical protein
MKVFFFLLFICIVLHSANSTATFPSPDYTNAIDAIERPRYKQALQNMFPHIDYDAAINSKKSKIINGDVSRLGDFPYQVLQYMSSDNVYWYTCGGILIAREWVLTVSKVRSMVCVLWHLSFQAGHCVFEFIRFELYFGIVQRPPSNHTWSTTIAGTQHITLHERYDDATLANDIALIFLATAPENLLEMPYVGAVGLPIVGDAEVDLVGVVASVSGFGSECLCLSIIFFEIKFEKFEIKVENSKLSSKKF